MPTFIKKLKDKDGEFIAYSAKELGKLVTNGSPHLFEVTESHAQQVLRHHRGYQEVPDVEE